MEGDIRAGAVKACVNIEIISTLTKNICLLGILIHLLCSPRSSSLLRLFKLSHLALSPSLVFLTPPTVPRAAAIIDNLAGAFPRFCRTQRPCHFLQSATRRVHTGSHTFHWQCIPRPRRTLSDCLSCACQDLTSRRRRSSRCSLGLFAHAYQCRVLCKVMRRTTERLCGFVPLL